MTTPTTYKELVEQEERGIPVSHLCLEKISQIQSNIFLVGDHVMIMSHCTTNSFHSRFDSIKLVGIVCKITGVDHCFVKITSITSTNKPIMTPLGGIYWARFRLIKRP